MAISNVSLSASARSNLVSLQLTADLLGTSESRLSSGKKVNTAIDDASAYFKSQSFLNRASDLNSIKDDLSTSLQTIKAASNAIDSITKIVQQLQGLVNSAQQTSDTTARATLATQFNTLRDQLDALVNDATFNGTNLLKSTESLVVKFNEDNSSTLTISGVDLSAGASGLHITAPTNGFNTADIDLTVLELQTALTTLRTNASTFGTNATLVQTRADFTKNLANTLQVASDNLVLADINEEGANVQALQARAQLGISALSISGQQQSAILKLF